MSKGLVQLSSEERYQLWEFIVHLRVGLSSKSQKVKAHLEEVVTRAARWSLTNG